MGDTGVKSWIRESKVERVGFDFTVTITDKYTVILVTFSHSSSPTLTLYPLFPFPYLTPPSHSYLTSSA